MTDEGKILIERMARALIRGAVRELKEQGHVASGKGIRSFEVVNKSQGAKLVADVIVNDYLVELDKKQPPKVIPMSDLVQWAKFVKRGLSTAQQIKFSQAVQFKIEDVGVPTPGAYQFTSNGRRTEWIEFGAQKAAKEIRGLFDKTDIVEKELDKAIREAEQLR